MENKDFTLYPESFELKQLGFDEPCFTFYQVEYHENSPIMVDDNDQYRITGFRTCKNSEIPSHYISCPTYSQAFRWFREKYNIEGITQHAEDRLWYKFHISTYLQYGKKNIHAGFEYPTYEEAELACLKKLIEIVQGGNK